MKCLEEYRSGASQHLQPNSISSLAGKGYSKEKHCPLHAPQVNAFMESTRRARSGLGIEATKSAAVDPGTCALGMVKLLEEVKEYMKEGKPLLARRTLLQMADVVLCIDLFMRAQTITSIELGDIKAVAATLEGQYVGNLAFTVDATGKDKIARIKGEISDVPDPEKAVYTAYAMPDNALLCPSLAIAIRFLLQGPELWVASCWRGTYGEDYTLGPFTDAPNVADPGIAARMRGAVLPEIANAAVLRERGGPGKATLASRFLGAVPARYTGGARVVALTEVVQRELVNELRKKLGLPLLPPPAS